jgi:hypothetical protein
MASNSLGARASLEARMRSIVQAHAVADDYPNPGRLARELDAIVDGCSPAELRYLEGLGAAMLAAIAQLDDRASDGPKL